MFGQMSLPALKISSQTMKKLLVANRSEIAVRIFRSASELNLSEPSPSMPKKIVLECTGLRLMKPICVGKGKGPVAAYLDIDSIISLAKEKKVDMIIQAMVFCPRMQNLPELVKKAGIVFVGPRPELLERMGDKGLQKKLLTLLEFLPCQQHLNLFPNHPKH